MCHHNVDYSKVRYIKIDKCCTHAHIFILSRTSTAVKATDHFLFFMSMLSYVLTCQICFLIGSIGGCFSLLIGVVGFSSRGTNCQPPVRRPLYFISLKENGTVNFGLDTSYYLRSALWVTFIFFIYQHLWVLLFMFVLIKQFLSPTFSLPNTELGQKRTQKYF